MAGRIREANCAAPATVCGALGFDQARPRVGGRPPYSLMAPSRAGDASIASPGGSRARRTWTLQQGTAPDGAARQHRGPAEGRLRVHRQICPSVRLVPPDRPHRASAQAPLSSNRATVPRLTHLNTTTISSFSFSPRFLFLSPLICFSLPLPHPFFSFPLLVPVSRPLYRVVAGEGSGNWDPFQNLDHDSPAGGARTVVSTAWISSVCRLGCRTGCLRRCRSEMSPC